MHPPFGFALFYLRSVAPRATFLDRVTGRLTAPVTTGQIYWGAVPFVVIQVIMGLTIAFPGMVTHYKAGQSTVDPNKVQIEGPSARPAAARYEPVADHQITRSTGRRVRDRKTPIIA